MRSWRIQVRQTRDLGFYDRSLCHARYCVVSLAVDKYEAAVFARRLLSHRALNTQTKRMGKVIRVTHSGLSVWGLRMEEELSLAWAE